jgi:hypothetical protein
LQSINRQSQLTNIQDDIVEGEFDNVVGDLFLYAPALDNLVDLTSSLLRDLIKDGRVGRIERL